jgi:phosphate transport system substrate-binding protein
MKMNNFVVFGLLVLSVIVAGCTTSQTNGPTGNVVADTQQVVQKQQMEKIEITGSDTLLQVVSSLAEAFKEKDSNVRISVTGGGSGTGIAALINGDIDIADSSRKIKAEELQKAKDKGAEAIEIPIARDTLSVIVHPSNTVKQLTMDQVSKIFKGEITNWKELGGADSTITLYGRQSTSGTYVYFMEEVVKGDYSPKMRNMEGSQAIVDAVAQDKTGTGYTGIGYVMDEYKQPIKLVTTLKIAKDKNSDYVTPLDDANINIYPISRELYQYLADKPTKDSAVYRFITFIISDEGQDVVENEGFVRISDEERAKVIATLQ